MIMEKPNPELYNSQGHYEADLEKYNEMKSAEQTQPSQCAGVWVYLPELPKTAGTYIVEFTTKYVERCAFYGDKKQFFVGSDNVTEYVKRWLDESQQQCAVSDEEIEKMAKSNAINEVGDMPLETDFENKEEFENAFSGWEFLIENDTERFIQGFKAALRKQVWDK